MFIIGFLSKDSPVVGVGKPRERLGSSRVSMNNKSSHKYKGEESLWEAHGLGSSHQVMDVSSVDLAVPLDVVFPMPPSLPLSLI